MRVFRVAVWWVCCFVLMSWTTASAREQPRLEIRRSESTGLALALSATKGFAIPIDAAAADRPTRPEDVFCEYGSLFGISDPSQQLRRTTVRTDRLGQRHTSFEQLYRGVPVFTGTLKVHQDAAGRVLAVNGHSHEIPASLDTRPKLTPAQASGLALRRVVAIAPEIAEQRLVVVDPGWYGDFPRGALLAYHIVVRCPVSGALEALLIDAHSGETVDQWSLVFHDRERRVYDGQGSADLPGQLARAEGDPPAEPLSDPVAADINRAYDNIGDFYNFFATTFGRDSLDDLGMPLVATVNSRFIGDLCPTAQFNADREQVVFCLGRVPDDVVAHEFTHGLTFHTANFLYQNQGGALHEHFSFVFGETVDLYNSGSERAGQTLGPPPWARHATDAGIDQPNLARSGCSRAPDYADGVRWLYNEDRVLYEGAGYDYWDPTCFNHPDRALSPLQDCPLSDGGGTHLGAEIPNHAYALVVDGGSFNGIDVSGIGLMKAAHVWYRALTVYLTGGSDFADASWALNRAAADLVGRALVDPRTGELSADLFSAEDAAQVAAALRAVELDTPGRCGQGQNGLDDSPPPSCSDRTILLHADFEGGLPADWSTSSSQPPSDYQWRVTEPDEPLPYGRSGRAAFCADPLDSCIGPDESGLHSLLSPVLTLPGETHFPVLEFTHLMGCEGLWDGGNLKLSVNHGAWQQIPPDAFVYNPYGQVLLSAVQGSSNPLGGQLGFSGASGGWGTTVIALGALVSAGDELQLRFDFGKDLCGGVVGWYVDDLTLSDCRSAADCDGNDLPDEMQLELGNELAVVASHPSGHGERSSSDADAVTGATPNVEAERFILLVPQVLRAVRIWGGYFPFNSLPGDHFTVLIHAADPVTGLPGRVVAAKLPQLVGDDATGFLLKSSVTERELILRFREPVALPAGSYWLEVFADTADEFDTFVWSRGDFDPPLIHTASAGEAPGQEWTVNGAFHLASEILAEPVGADCNHNGRLDSCDVAGGFSVDGDANGVPDECQAPAPRRSHGPR